MEVYMTDRFETFTTDIASIYKSIQKIKKYEMNKIGLKGTHVTCMNLLNNTPEGLTASEICLLAKRGHPKRYSKSVHQFIISPVEEHSKKPDITREKIIALAGDLPRAELFARQKTPGWDVWGNELDSDFSLSVPETR